MSEVEAEREALSPAPATGGPELLRVAAWTRTYPWLLHGFTTRRHGRSTVYLKGEPAPGATGELNLGYTADDAEEAVRANRVALARALSADAEPMLPLVLVRQVHATEVRLVQRQNLDQLMGDSRAVTDGDGLITAEPGVLLGVQAADCVPILIADTRLRMVTALHAGWRGTVAGIVPVGVGKMVEMGSRVDDLVAAIGPSIGPCCYGVGVEVEEMFQRQYPYAGELFEVRDGGNFLNLWEANRRQLVDAGIAADRTSVSAQCSACTMSDSRRLFFSHRADRGHSGRMMGVIGISPDAGRD